MILQFAAKLDKISSTGSTSGSDAPMTITDATTQGEQLQQLAVPVYQLFLHVVMLNSIQGDSLWE